MFERVPQKIDFPESERRVLARWRERGIFEKSLALRQGRPTFVFYEGPPTANGTPHNGHVLTRVIKDLFPRYKTMRGYLVPRKAGWDTHGLPVEVEVEKELGIHGKEEIEKYGVEAFTRKCIESVFRYTDVWRELTERIGFWVDLDSAYVTYHRQYVESVWWALSRLFDKGLLYQGHKIVWWWPQGGTALSAAEVGLGYKTVDDPSVTVRFRLADTPGHSFLGWTTTPWTLPSNCALAVHEDLDYVFARRDGDEEVYVVAAAQADAMLGEGAHEVLRTVRGAELVGIRYAPVFDYAVPESGRYHIVIAADFVTADAGSGVVHVAPAFGEDDFKTAAAQGIGLLQLVGPDGRFDARVTDFAGRFCKEADRDIIRDLRRRELLFKEEVYRHDYPFCWRADDDPLIQYARPTWFIRTTDVKERVLANNQQINWVPEHIKDGRFGDWLANNVDWALSRERYWGTPLNIWICDACDAREAPASADAILARDPQAFAGFDAARAADPSLSPHLMVHKPWIDDVTFGCAACDGGTMRRVTEVIDCWFDSGCMPFAQWGYPHTGVEDFKAAFPADFISEAIDQTRGWFYSLLMISTLLDDETALPHPYKTCIVLGHVCDKTGKKESKSKGNYTPPGAILDTDGADAMRWYFYAANPPWSNTRYSPENVRQSQQEFLLKLRNVYAFFVIYANIDGFDPRTSPSRPVAERGLLDRWILSELHLALGEVTVAMDDYRIYDAAQRIVRLADAVSNWYVRRSRERFWAPVGAADDAAKWDAYQTLYEVLTTMAGLAAPFVPFITEEIYDNLVLTPYPERPESVHLTDWPDAVDGRVDDALSEEMQVVRDLVSLGLQIRASHKHRVRQPLAEAEIILGHPELTDRVRAYADLIADELNVKKVVFTQEAAELVTFKVKPNYRALGPSFGKRMPLVRKALDAAEGDAVRRALAETGAYALTLSDGEQISLTADHVQVAVEAHGEGFAAAGGPVGVVVLDATLTEALITEGLAREVTSRVQGLRKTHDLEYTARILVEVSAAAAVGEAVAAFAGTIAAETLADAVVVVDALSEGGMVSEGALADAPLGVRIVAASR